jgi:hypothetical protein
LLCPWEPGIDKLTPRIAVAIGYIIGFAPAFAQDGIKVDFKTTPMQLTLQVTTDPSDEQCRRIETSDPASLAPMLLHRTFQDDFDEHPLSKGKWAPH